MIMYLLNQAYYRQLGIVAIHAPVDEVYKAVEELAAEHGGVAYWAHDRTEGHAFRWDGIEMFPDIPPMNLWFFGGKRRRENTVMVRRGWWAMYIIDPPGSYTSWADKIRGHIKRLGIYAPDATVEGEETGGIFGLGYNPILDRFDEQE